MSLRTYETLASFAAVQAKPGDLLLTDAPELPGRKAWQVRLTPQSTPLDGEQRVHCLTDEFLQPGSTVTFGSAYYLAADRPAGRGWDSIFEIHQGWHGPDLSYNGPAPGCGMFDGDRLTILARGGLVRPVNQGASGFIQHLWGGYAGAVPFAGGESAALVKAQWFTLLVTVHLDPAAGWLRAERNGVEIVPKTACPTCYPFAMFGMPVNGYRMGSANPNTAIHWQWSAIGDEAEVRQYLTNYLAPPAPAPVPAGPDIPGAVTQLRAALRSLGAS